MAKKKIIWSLSPFVGLYSPSLKLLNEGELKSPLTGEARVYDEKGKNVTIDFEYRNPLPKIGPAREYGFELHGNITKRNTFLFGGSFMEQQSKITNIGRMPLQGDLTDVENERRLKISYNQIYLGWRYKFYSKSNKFNFFTRLSVHEMFDIDLREDMVFTFLSGESEGFKRLIILQSKTNGVVMFQPGIGAEYVINKKISLIFEGGYFFGIDKYNLKYINVLTDIQSSDNIPTINLPTKPDKSGNLLYLLEDASDYRPLQLDFAGLKVLFAINIYF